MSFDIGDDGGSGIPGVKLMTKQEIMERAEKLTRDETTGEPLVIIPKDSDLGEAITTRHMHGYCKHFQLEQGQKDCLEQRFWERMLREEKYRKEWFDNPATYGECPYFEGRLMGFFHPAVIVASDVDASLYGKKGAMDKIACPYFVDKRKSGTSAVFGKYVKTNVEY